MLWSEAWIISEITAFWHLLRSDICVYFTL